MNEEQETLRKVYVRSKAHGRRGILAHALTGERLLATLFLVLSISYGLGTFSFYRTLSSDVVGPAYFPRILAVIGVALALVYLARSRLERREEKPFEAQRIMASLVGELWPVVLVLAYALLLTPLGFIPSTLLFFAATMIALGEPIRSAVLYALVVTAALFFLFFVFLQAELPMGTFLPLDRMVPQIGDLRHLLF
ncbi:tripartite tricarboxylate transporter TctB family protein [Afifella pfennigii]|uniref:tripartite tricarboxylate transporter TctB family protein n=1 Tax=Afifella pfennigii TaxID=209897 RepID=UPI00047B1F2F|nr:tripartite tricarboxylate transporter TctB family protein [Afifella pfennigii]